MEKQLNKEIEKQGRRLPIQSVIQYYRWTTNYEPRKMELTIQNDS